MGTYRIRLANMPTTRIFLDLGACIFHINSTMAPTIVKSVMMLPIENHVENAICYIR